MINKKERVNIFLFLRGAVGTLLLMCILFMSAGTGIASETASDAIIQNARNETEMLLAIRNAAWLKYTDEWDSYLETRKTNPAASAPVFSSIRLTGGNGLVTGGYLPDSFPVSNYVITPSGNELNVSTILDAASASLVPNFLPLAQVSGGNVTLKVTRPGATAGLSFFLDKYAANEMGNFSTIEWLDGYGFISVDSIEVNNISSQNGGPVNIAGGAAISGDASVTGDMTVSGTVTAARGNFGALGGTRLEGDLDANGHNIHSAGIVSGKTGNFENLGATKLAGNMDANGKNITGAGNVSAQNFTASGKVSGNTGEFSGDISARNVTASETVKGKTGNFDNLGATKLAGNMDANGKNITGAGRIEGKTVEGDTGNFDRLGKTTLDGDMSASNHNISGTGTVSMGTGEFTTAKANTLTAKTAGGTIAVASPMNITGKLTASGDAVFAGGMTVDKNMETKGDIALWAPANGKWNRGIYVKDAAGNTMGGIAASGRGADMESIFIGYGNNPSSMKKGIFIGPDGVTNVSGNFSAAAVNAGSGIIQTTGEVKGGTASFPVVKANVIDSNGAASIEIRRAVALGNNSITTRGAGTFDTVNITSDKTSALRVVGRINAGSAGIAGNLSAGTISVSGKITAGEVSATNGSFKTLAVNGKKGTQLDPYDFYVKHAKNASFADTATNANYATNAGKAVNADYATRSSTTALADDSKKLEGYTLNEILKKVTGSSTGIPHIVVNRTSGSQTLAVTAGVWYKIDISGSAGIGKNTTVSYENSESSWTETVVVNGGTGANYVFYVKAPATSTWTITFYQAPAITGVLRGGAAVEVKDGATIIVVAGGGGGGGRYDGTHGGRAGYGNGAVAGVAGTALYGNVAGGAGGAAASGTRAGVGNGGSGYTRGGGGGSWLGVTGITYAAGGGGGSSYLNTGYGSMKQEVPGNPYVNYATPYVKIWRMY